MYIIKPKFWDNPRITLWAISLYPFSLIVKILILIRKLTSKEIKFNIPVLCIGNIYIGGTGKTPTSIEIFKIVKSLGKNPGFIKKYYKFLKDEIIMLEKIGDTFSKKNRKSAIKDLVKNNNDVAILDDGFQDVSIKKNLSILCFNSKQWTGNGLIIPAGPLRDSKKIINKADCVVINGRFKIKDEQLRLIKIPIFYTQYKIKNLGNLVNKKIIAFAGIGNPSNFFELLIYNRINLVKSYSFPDHHEYSNSEIDKMLNECKTKNATLVTTEKDHSRLDQSLKEKCDFVKVDLKFDDENKFKNFVKKFI